MSHTQRFRPTGVLVAAGALLGAVALAGCSAGQITQTDTQIPAVTGANGGVGTIAVRDAQIEFGEQVHGANVYPRGGTAPLRMSVVNTGIEPDRLVSASSPAASAVTITGTADIPPGRVLLVEGGPAASGAAAPGSARSTASAAPASPAAQPSGEAATQPGSESGSAGHEPSLPPGSREAQVVLTGLTSDIRAGLTYELVLNFEKAGQVKLNVPVGYPSEPREDEPAE